MKLAASFLIYIPFILLPNVLSEFVCMPNSLYSQLENSQNWLKKGEVCVCVMEVCRPQSSGKKRKCRRRSAKKADQSNQPKTGSLLYDCKFKVYVRVCSVQLDNWVYDVHRFELTQEEESTMGEWTTEQTFSLFHLFASAVVCVTNQWHWIWRLLPNSLKRERTKLRFTRS